MTPLGIGASVGGRVRIAVSVVSRRGRDPPRRLGPIVKDRSIIYRIIVVIIYYLIGNVRLKEKVGRRRAAADWAPVGCLYLTHYDGSDRPILWLGGYK